MLEVSATAAFFRILALRELNSHLYDQISRLVMRISYQNTVLNLSSFRFLIPIFHQMCVGLSPLHHGSGADTFHFWSMCVFPLGAAVLRIHSVTATAIQSPLQQIHKALTVFLLDARAQCSNSAQSRSRGKGSQTQIQH